LYSAVGHVLGTVELAEFPAPRPRDSLDKASHSLSPDTEGDQQRLLYANISADGGS